MKRKFWNWARDADDMRILFLNGVISDETWFGDEVTPEVFRKELYSGEGEVTVWINSPGGDVFAAAQIYTMLMEYPWPVHVRIDALAGSAASVVAMAGTDVAMSPVAMMMIHNPATITIGDAQEIQKTVDMLSEVKESILNAYELKSNLPRARIAGLMDDETWMNAKKAVELGFADRVLYTEGKEDADVESMLFSCAAVRNDFLHCLQRMKKQEKSSGCMEADVLRKRLDLLLH